MSDMTGKEDDKTVARLTKAFLEKAGRPEAGRIIVEGENVRIDGDKDKDEVNQVVDQGKRKFGEDFWNRTLGSFDGENVDSVKIRNKDEGEVIIELADKVGVDRKNYSDNKDFLDDLQKVYFAQLLGEDVLEKRGAVLEAVRKNENPQITQELTADLYRGFSKASLDLPEVTKSRLSDWLFVGGKETVKDEILDGNTARNEVRAAFRREQKLMKVPEDGAFKRVTRRNKFGIEQPIFSEILNNPNQEIRNTAEKLDKEAEAREKLHRFYVLYDRYRTSLDLLVAALGKPRMKDEAPVEHIEEFDFSVLDVLTKLDEKKEGDRELSKNIAKGISLYMKIGEKHSDLYLEMMLDEEKGVLKVKDEKTGKVEEKPFTRDLWWKEKFPDEKEREEIMRNSNIFSSPLNPAKIEKIRRSITLDIIGKKESWKSVNDEDLSLEERDLLENAVDAEEIAFRLMYLFGYAAKYNMELHPGCSLRDSLGDLFYPNESWQGLRSSNEKIPAPVQVIGEKGNFRSQPLRGLTMLQSFPEYLNLHREPGSKNIHKLLLEGKFDEVDWKAIPRGYGAWTFQVAQAYRLGNTLSELKPGAEVMSVDFLNGLSDNIGKVLGGLYNSKSKLLTDDEKIKEAEAMENFVIPIKYTWMKGVLGRVDPRDYSVPHEQTWDTRTVKFFLGRLKEADFLPDKYLKLDLLDFLTWSAAKARRLPNVR